jgi:hypothetical protein
MANKKKGIIIAVVIAAIIIGVGYAVGSQQRQQQQQEQQQQMMPDGATLEQEVEQYLAQEQPKMGYLSNVGAEGIVKSRYLPPGQAVVVMITPLSTGWSGEFQGSDSVSESFSGAGNRYKALRCDSGGIYSVTVQKMSEVGIMRVQVWQGGEKLREGDTQADYGVVSFAGDCR